MQSIIRIADSATTPLKAIFFVEELIKEKTTIKDLNKITENQDEYFKKMIEMRQVYFIYEI